MILRGGRETNYDTASVGAAAELLRTAELSERLMIDCSHANSHKQHDRQREVCADIGDQIGAGDKRIMGVMIESHLVAGRQNVVPGQDLIYGQSITDACIGWEDTVTMLDQLAAAVRARRAAAPSRAIG